VVAKTTLAGVEGGRFKAETAHQVARTSMTEEDSKMLTRSGAVDDLVERLAERRRAALHRRAVERAYEALARAVLQDGEAVGAIEPRAIRVTLGQPAPRRAA
jgi:hypothetical protein